MAKEFLHKEGLTKLVENIKAWAKGAFLGKDATITKSSGTNNGVSVSIQGSVSAPSVGVSVTTSGVSGNNTGVVSGSEVKAYVDENAATKDTFKAATSSSNAVNGLVPAPSSANATKFLRGDGTWSVPPLATNNTDGLMGADDKTTLGQSVAMVTPLTGEDGSCILEIERNDGTFLEFPVPKVGSAKEADNALKLGGTPLSKIHELVSFNSMLIGDTEGWYRIAYSISYANFPRSFMLFLERQYGYDSPESYVFSISNTMGDYFSITQLSGAASSRLIDRIRVVNSASVSDYVYVDIHINPSSGYQNRVYWGVVGNAAAYNRGEVVFNPELPGVNMEFETVNGFKTNLSIYEGSAALSEKYVEKLASNVFHGNRGVLTTENVAVLHCGLYNSYESMGGINLLPINHASVVQFGSLHYTPQMCLNNTGKRLWFRNITRSAPTEQVSEWNEVAFIKDITDGKITAAKATTADSANAIGGKGLGDLVQGGGTIKFIKVVTSLPANASSDTLYLIKQ